MVQPNKKEIVILAVVLVVTLGLTAGAIYSQKQHQDSVNSAVKTAQEQRASAIKQVEQVTATSKVNLQAVNNSLTTEHAKLVNVCDQLTRSRLKNPACTAPIE